MSQYIKDPLFVRIKNWFNSLLIVRGVIWLFQYALGWGWIWSKIIYPIIQKMATIYKWVGVKYMDFWKWAVYDKEGNFRVFRSAATIMVTTAMIWVIPAFIWLSINTGAWVFTGKSQEVVFLTSTQEIDPENDVHAIRGCESLPCTNDNSIYFRVKSNLFVQAYSFASGEGMFYPDLVASVVAPGVNKCTVDSYGIRVKTFMKKWEIYPYMLGAVCMPVSGDNVHTGD